MSHILPAGDPGALALAAAALAGGGLVVLPTDTVYGIAARVDRPDGLAAVFEAKARPPALALPVLAARVEDALELGELSPAARALAAAFWPGPLTLVVTRRPGFDAELGGDGITVGLRVPADRGARALLSLTGPLATTSANRSGDPTPSAIEEIAAVFGDAVAVYLDGGPAPGATSSTVVSVLGDAVVVLREGALAPAEVFRAVAGD